MDVSKESNLPPGRVLVVACRCLRCGHTWLPRNENERIRACAKCKSAYWDSPRKDQTATNKKRAGGKAKAKRK